MEPVTQEPLMKKYTCLDFLNNKCKNGNECKFIHPGGSVVPTLQYLKFEYVFCPKFRQSGTLDCVESGCRFVHGTEAEQSSYKSTGKLPPHLLDFVKEHGITPEFMMNGQILPLCKDYIKGKCESKKCANFHFTIGENEVGLHCLFNEKSKNSFFDSCDRYGVFSRPVSAGPPQPISNIQADTNMLLPDADELPAMHTKKVEEDVESQIKTATGGAVLPLH